ncbi:Eisosome component PIL1 domain containing protein [Amanita muscaria]
MPVPHFFASFADKAQNAINSSPLASHLPASLTNQQGAQGANPDSSSQSGPKTHALETISNQLRVISQQYSSATPVQKIVTAEKGVALDFESLSRSSKYQSKELYTWGQSEPADLQDVVDRLAYLNFVQGSLAGSLAQKLISARGPLKALRDAENVLAPRRAARFNLATQIAKVEHDQQKGSEKRLAELREQLRRAELEDHSLEKEIEILKRKAIRDSETAKWEVLREYGEKLVLMSQAASQVITALPPIPPTSINPYTGAPTTAAARAALQRALDNYKTGHINLPSQSQVDLDRSDTRSFGESHATELSNLDSAHSDITHSPPSAPSPLQQTTQVPIIPDKATTSPIDPSNLNQSPAPIPAASLSGPSDTSESPAIVPTVAETGIPVSAGPDGPGPATGSLHDLKAGAKPSQPSTDPAPETVHVEQHETAEEEKKRLERKMTLAAGGSNPPPHETAEEEKKRLEREEREKTLAAGGSNPPPQKDDDELPPYKEF